jgi:hypothetical protein
MVRRFRATLREKVTIFSLVMTAVMVAGMSSLNLVWREAWTVEVFFSGFPILFMAAFLLQLFVTMPLAKKAADIPFEMAKKK